MSNSYETKIKLIVEKLKPLWMKVLEFADRLPFERKYTFAGVAVLVVGFFFVTGSSGTSPRDIQRMCEAEYNHTINMLADFGRSSEAPLQETIRDTCCPLMRKEARRLSSYERDVVFAEMARGSNDYSPNDRQRFIQFFQDARNNVTQSEWQRMREPTSVKNQCTLRVIAESRRG